MVCLIEVPILSKAICKFRLKWAFSFYLTLQIRLISFRFSHNFNSRKGNDFVSTTRKDCLGCPFLSSKVKEHLSITRISEFFWTNIFKFTEKRSGCELSSWNYINYDARRSVNPVLLGLLDFVYLFSISDTINFYMIFAVAI